MPTLIFNFKTYVGAEKALRAASRIAALGSRFEVVIAPPQISIYAMSSKLRGAGVSLCAQGFDYSESRGAHTGDVSIEDLKDAGCRYAIIGHSEARHRHAPRCGESDSLIAMKMRSCIDHGITPVLCLGEGAAEKRAGKSALSISRQFRSATSLLKKSEIERITLAYEPIWSISSSENAEPCSIEHVSIALQSIKKAAGNARMRRFLYGGSVDHRNIMYYLSSGIVDGVLIGRAGTDSSEFERIYRSLSIYGR